MTKQPYGGVLIVQGGPAVAPLLVDYLAKQLASLGWSVALLNVNQQGTATPWIEQLPDALSALRQKSNQRLILLHYGGQLQVLIDYFSKLQSKQVNGLILLSAFNLPENKNIVDLLQKIPFPLLDITGQFDYDMILAQAKGREQPENKRYSDLQVPGAEHDYYYTKRLLAAYLHGWMIKLPAATPAKPPIILDTPSLQPRPR